MTQTPSKSYGVKECKPLEMCDQNHYPFERFHRAYSDLTPALAVHLLSVAIYKSLRVDLFTCEDLEIA